MLKAHRCSSILFMLAMGMDSTCLELPNASSTSQFGGRSDDRRPYSDRSANTIFVGLSGCIELCGCVLVEGGSSPFHEPCHWGVLVVSVL